MQIVQSLHFVSIKVWSLHRLLEREGAIPGSSVACQKRLPNRFGHNLQLSWEAWSSEDGQIHAEVGV